jgi:hypothetical protein
MLISMPTGTSTIFGVFQAIWLSFLEPDELRPPDKVLPKAKFASEIFFMRVPARLPAASQKHCSAVGKRVKPPLINGFGGFRTNTKAE